jgi:hypothetical protein
VTGTHVFRRAQQLQIRSDLSWPDGIVEMPMEDESYFRDIYHELKARISKVRGTWMIGERRASPEVGSIDDEDENEPDEAWLEGSRSYHLFVIRPQTTIRLPIDDGADTGEGEDFRANDNAQDDVGAESEFGAEGFDEPEVIGFSMGFLLAISLVAPVAIVMEYALQETEYGTDASPPLSLPCAFDSSGKVVDPDRWSHLNAGDRKRADAIRERLVRAVEKTGLTILPFDQRQKTVPGLQADSETFLRQSITVQDAFFFDGL